MKSKNPKHLNESDKRFVERIRLETKKKILETSKPLDLDALTTSMSLDEPTHLGSLIKRPVNYSGLKHPSFPQP